MSESQTTSPSKLIPREQEGDEEHFITLAVRVVKRDKSWLVDTKHLRKALTPHLIKL
jgi:hypothetical protein